MYLAFYFLIFFITENGFVYAQYGRIAHIGVYTVLHSVLIFNHFWLRKIKIMNKYIFVFFLFLSLNKGVSQTATLTKDSIIQIVIPFELSKNKIEIIIDNETVQPINNDIENINYYYCEPCKLISYRNFDKCIDDKSKIILMKLFSENFFQVFD
jgi:hypothetical protein